MKKRLLTIISAAAIGTLLLGGVSTLSASASARADAPPEIIVDNSQATTTGAWTKSRYKQHFYGDDYLTIPKSATVTATIRWTPDVVTAGTYGVYYLLPDGGPDRAWDLPFRVHDSAGDVGYSVDAQPAVGGNWIHLGDHTFATGTSGYVELTNKAGAVVVGDAIKLGKPIGLVDYTIRPDMQKQKILGIGVEIQSDSIKSGNSGLDDTSTAYVPADLTPSERQRFYDEMLHGFRYVRLAMGLYLRGLTPDRENIVERYPGQMALLKEMIEESGMEGADVEYWSPAPAWKDNNSYIGGGLKLAHMSEKADRDAFLAAYSDAMVEDIRYLEENGVPVKQWSLQNEPTALTGYSSIYYDHQEYFDVFRTVAPKIKAYDPDIFIHGDSHHGQTGQGSALIKADDDPVTGSLQYLDAWSQHRNWGSSDELIDNAASINSGLAGKQVFNSEWEFLDNTTSEKKMLETAQSIMNWMVFMDAPTWYWLHALKPTYNKEAEGYGLGLWRPSDDPIEPGDPYADIQPQHWKPIPTNWHGVAPFVQHLPWDSTRLQVDERVVRKSQRIMAWTSPEGELGIALTNRSDSPFRFNIDLGSDQTLVGHRYDKTVEDQVLTAQSGQRQQIIVPPNSIEIWNAETATAALDAATLSSDSTVLQPFDTAATTLAATLSDGADADLSSATVAYGSSDTAVASIDGSGLVTAKAPGSAHVWADVTLDGVTVRSAELAITVGTPLSRAKPATPVLSSNSGHRTGLRDGDYDVSMDLWWGDNAAVYRLYENGTLIHSERLADASPAAQHAVVPVTGKPNGIYTYTAELTNTFGTTTSTPLVVTITDASPGTPVLSQDNWDRNGAYLVTTDLWWGTNATEVRVYENDVLIDTQQLTAATPGAQRATTTVTGRAPGSYTYRAEFRNPRGVTSSASITVIVDH